MACLSYTCKILQTKLASYNHAWTNQCTRGLVHCEHLEYGVLDFCQIQERSVFLVHLDNSVFITVLCLLGQIDFSNNQIKACNHERRKMEEKEGGGGGGGQKQKT